MRNLKLLQIFPSTVRGGAEEYALAIGVASVASGWDVHVAFPERGSTSSLRADFNKKGVCCHPLEVPSGNKGRIQFLLEIIRTLFLLLKVKPDAVHITMPCSDHCVGSILACALLKRSTVIVFQLVTEYQLPEVARIKYIKWSRNRNQHWVAISDNNRELLVQFFGVRKDDIKLVFNGSLKVNRLSSVTERSLARDQIRKELGLPPSGTVIITVGRLNPQKGYASLIPAIPHIIESHPNVSFVWVGEGEQREELTSLINEYGVTNEVVMLGHRTDIQQLLLASDFFLLPTLFEGGSSIALLEAMRAGVPVIASNASGIPEIVENNVHGILFRKTDSIAILKSVNWAIENPCEMERMAQRAMSRADAFSVERMSSETIELLNDCVVEH